jgi:hypothetical protein
MQDRLAELRRQRALVAEHLAWLDRELGALSTAATPAPAVPAPTGTTPVVTAGDTPPTSAVPPATPAPTADIAPAAIELLPETKPTEIKQDVRRGCLLYFAIASAAAIAAIALLVWASQAYKRSHPSKPRIEQPAQP